MKQTLLFISTTICLLINASTYALSTDRDQPANIEADDIEFNFKKGTRIYIDNVLAVQGSLRLKAEKLVANYKDSELQKATAWGSLARFKQRPDDKPDDVEGWAEKIIVDQKNNTLTLIGKAALKQGADTARGDTIIYNMANDTLKIKGGAIGNNKKSDKPKAKDTDKTTAKQADPFDDSTAQGPIEKTPKNPVKPTASGRSRLIIQPK